MAGTGTLALPAPNDVGCSVLTWNTPYPVLAGGVASAGIPFWCRSPRAGTWTVPSWLADSTGGAALAAQFQDPEEATSTLTVNNGRWDAVVGYWAGGAPGFHGATSSQQVAYAFTLTPRPAAGRAWFGANEFFFALGGHGWVRIDHEVGGVFTPVVPLTHLSETDFLRNGLHLTATLGFTGTYHVYYAQDTRDPWGGFVVKAVPGPRSAGTPDGTQADTRRAREAPVVSSGLFDDGAPPPAQAVYYIDSLDVQQQIGQASTARVVVDLLNPEVHDGAGWELVRTGPRDEAYLRMWDGGTHNSEAVTLRIGRTLQIRGGYGDNQANLFTGTIADFDDTASGKVAVVCYGVEQRLNERFDRNYPDPISYMSANYRALEAVGEPVYGIPAFDAWPLELALAECAQRGGLDASVLYTPKTVPTSTTLWQPVVDAQGAPVRRFRARTLAGEWLKLDRPIHYGNAGLAFDAGRRADDAYGFKPESTQMLWQRMRTMADRYGYDVRGDADGAVQLQARHNPYLATVPSASAGYTQALQPAAYGGQYLATTGTTPVTIPVRGARFDLALGLGPTVRRQWSVRVLKGASVVAGPLTLTAPAADADVWFYGTRHSPTTLNAAVVTVWSGDYGDYTLELTPLAGVGAEHRLNAVFAYDVDPDRPIYPYPLSTDVSALRIQTRSAQADQRNHVVVVGRRKAAVTDSEKATQNPENPDGEFVVESAVDVASVVDPTASNYRGYPREALIYDNAIADGDYAAWVARTFIYRQAQPLPTATLTHTLLPTLRLREPVYLDETRFQSVTPNQVFYVTGFTHRWSGEGVLTDVTATGQPEYPSYEPRADVDIDVLYGGEPVAQVQVQYQSLTNHLQVNLGPDAVKLHTDTLAVGSGAGDVLEYTLPLDRSGAVPKVQLPGDAPWPPVPGTVRFRTAGPTQPLLTVSSEVPNGGAQQTLQYGDALTVDIPDCAVGGIQSVTVQRYKRTTTGAYVTDGASIPLSVVPNAEFYYAPNYTEQRVVVTRAPNFSTTRDKVSVQVTVQYRKADDAVLSWSTNTPYHHFFNVGWTTRQLLFPWQEADAQPAHTLPTNAEQVVVQYRRHVPLAGNYGAGGSPFYDPYTSELGHLVRIRFDALISGQYRISVRRAGASALQSTVVAWLTEPTAEPDDAEAHWQYLEASAGVELVWDGVDQVGQHNQYQSELSAALLRGAFEDGKLETVGQGFYVWNCERNEAALGPLALISADLDAYGRPVFGVGTFSVWFVQFEARNDVTAARASVTRPAVRVVRTDALTPTYNSGSTSALVYTHLPAPTEVQVHPQYFSGVYQAEASTQTGTWLDGTPPLARFTNETPVRLVFTVKPRPGALWTGRGEVTSLKLTRHAHLRANIYDQFVVWDGTTYPKTAYPTHTVVSRRLTNDDHTWTFPDSGWRTAKAVEAAPWVFLPTSCRKTFGSEQEESLEWGNYLQLEEVPRWSGTTREIAGAHSRLHFALMNYQFFLSAYGLDRSGRRLWAVNPTFVDRSKIVNHDPAKYAEPYTLTHGPLPYLFQRRSVFTREWHPTTWQGGASGIGYGAQPLVTTLCDGVYFHDFNNPLSGMEADGYTGLDVQLPAAGFGAWTWGTQPTWIPSVFRDFHPYRCMPPMGGWLAGSVENDLSRTSIDQNWPENTGLDVWSSYARDMTGTNQLPFRPGFKAGWKDAPASNEGDQLHQDDTVHYEDVRGSWSKGPKPAQAALFTAPSTPYYANLFRYSDLKVVRHSATIAQLAFWQTAVTDWFRVAFRSEYVWESPAWFPVAQYGKERLDTFNYWLLRINQVGESLYYDHGAWAGWKDDLQGGTALVNSHRVAVPRNTPAQTNGRVFQGDWAPIALGPTLPTTQDATFRLVLVPERRG